MDICQHIHIIKSIVPIDGNLLKKWGEILRKQMNSEVFQNFQRLCDYMDVYKVFK